MTSITTYEDALNAVWDRSGYDKGFISNPFAGDEVARLGLRRTQMLVSHLGFPTLPYEIVHVAGSKGKGSTCAMIGDILRAAGCTTGRYLSPHLHSFRERFVINGESISEADFTSLTREAIEAAEAIEHELPELGQITAFELSTAMVLVWFAQRGCDIAVIEVGMGGTLDATNIVNPTISVITTLDYEHTAVLGDTMEEIASNKAGIIKPERPVLSARQPDEGRTVIEQRATEVDAPLFVEGSSWEVTGTHRNFTFRDNQRTLSGLHCTFAGEHQVANAGLAIASALAISEIVPSIEVSEDAIRSGLASAYLPGRFERAKLESGQTIVMDGAHTPASATALARTMQDTYPDTSVTVIIGMLSDKDPATVIEPLISLTGRWIIVEPDSPRALTLDSLDGILADYDIRAERAENIAHAIQLGSRSAGEVVLVTGSFTTVAEARVTIGLTAGFP